MPESEIDFEKIIDIIENLQVVNTIEPKQVNKIFVVYRDCNHLQN